MKKKIEKIKIKMENNEGGKDDVARTKIEREWGGKKKGNLVKSVPDDGHVEVSYLSARDLFVRLSFIVSPNIIFM